MSVVSTAKPIDSVRGPVPSADIVRKHREASAAWKRLEAKFEGLAENGTTLSDIRDWYLEYVGAGNRIGECMRMMIDELNEAAGGRE